MKTPPIVLLRRRNAQYPIFRIKPLADGLPPAGTALARGGMPTVF